MSRNITVIGSAHFDLIARPNSVLDPTVDRVGTIVIEAGGAGYNIACDLAWLGAPTVFVTALRKSPFSDILLSKLYSLGAEVECKFVADLPIGGFCAHLTTDGNLDRAISESPLDYTSVTSPKVSQCIQQSAIVVAECNLKEQDLGWLALQCAEYGKPLLVAGVSESKALRCRGLEHLITGLFFNMKEFIWYLRASNMLEHYDENASVSIDNLDVEPLIIEGQPYYLHVLAELIGTNLIITDAENGVWIASESKACRVAAPVLGAVSNYLGMGDLLLSLMANRLAVFSNISYRELKIALIESIPLVGEVSKSKHCNLGMRVQLEEEMDKVAKLTSTDPLTGLLNRRGLEKEIHTAAYNAVARKGKVVVMAVDIDFFKRINDTWGHHIGDQVLASLALILKEETRASDIVARLGGEEFLLVLLDETLERATQVAERIRARVANTDIDTIDADTREHKSIQITISLGITQIKDGESFEQLALRADKALYDSKAGGRNQATIR